MAKLTRKRPEGKIALLAGMVLAAFAVSTETAANGEAHYFRDQRGVMRFGHRSLGGDFLASDRGHSDVADRTRRYDALIRRYGADYGVDPALVKAVIHAESSFNRHAVSRRGARGLMQLMPRTARAYGVQDIHDPEENIRAGVRHLRGLLDRYRNDLRLAVAAYNAGAGAVARYRGVPPYRETRRYVDKVFAFRSGYLRDADLVFIARSVGGSDEG